MDAKRNRKWLWVAALLPFVSAIAVQATGSKARAISDAGPRDPLAFEQYLVNLGSPPPRAEYAGRFAFRNVGSQPLVIQKLEPSCGCLNPRLEKKEFAPGEQGEFYLRVRAANERPGPHEYTCKLIYDDGQTRETDVRFKITLPTERVEIRPRALAIYQFSDQVTTREISITDFRAAPDDEPLKRLDIVDVTCTLPWVDVAIGEALLDDAGQRRLSVVVKIAEVPPGTHQGTVLVKTNIKEYAELRVPLQIDGSDSQRSVARRTPRLTAKPVSQEKPR